MNRKPKCQACGGKRYIIVTRTFDNREAVERCDTCGWHGNEDPRNIYDEDAAKLAKADGVRCEMEYPCFIIKEGGP